MRNFKKNEKDKVKFGRLINSYKLDKKQVLFMLTHYPSLYDDLKKSRFNYEIIEDVDVKQCAFANSEIPSYYSTKNQYLINVIERASYGIDIDFEEVYSICGQEVFNNLDILGEIINTFDTKNSQVMNNEYSINFLNILGKLFKIDCNNPYFNSYLELIHCMSTNLIEENKRI